MTPEEQRQFTLMQEELVRLRGAMAALGGATGSAGKAASALLGPFASLFDAASRGATGLSTYNTILDQSAEELKKFIGFSSTFGTILTTMGDAGIAYVKMTTTMTDALMTGYQGFAAVGAAAKADLRDTAETFRKFGATSVADFPKITQMIAENGDTLAKLGGTMARGVTQFANLAASVQQSGLQTEFLAMGMTVDGINKGLAGYLKTITTTGQAQKMTQDQVNAGAAEYIRNMDVLSKLTGKSAETIQKERDERMQDDLYRLQRREQQKIVDRGGAEGARMAKTMEDNVELLDLLKAIDPTGKLEKAARRSMAPGGITTPEGQQLFQTDPETFRMLANRNRGGTESNEDILAQFARGGKALVDTFGSLRQFGGKSPGLDFVALMDLENRQAGQTARNAESVGAGKPPTTATQDAKDQQEAQRKQVDATVGVVVEIIQKQRQVAQDLSDMSTIGIVPVGKALAEIAEKFKKLTEILPGTRPLTDAQRNDQAGGEGVGRAVPGATRETIDRRAIDDLKNITDLLKESAAKAGVAAGSTLDAVITGIGELLKRPDQAVPSRQDNNQDQNQNTGPRPLLSGIVESMSASVSRAYVNIASVDNIRFPEMTTSYRTSLDPDMMSRVAGFPNSRETSTETESATLRDSDLIASNVLVSQKLDDLIDVMRQGVGYQRKISNQAYA
jgi:hypothetical protein